MYRRKYDRVPLIQIPNGNLQGTGNIKLEEGLGIYWAQVISNWKKGWESTGHKLYQTGRRVGNLQGTRYIKLEKGLGIYRAQDISNWKKGAESTGHKMYQTGRRVGNLQGT